MKGQPAYFASEDGHDKNIKIAVAVTGKGNLFAVMTPNRHYFMGCQSRQWFCFSAGCRHGVDIALPGKRDRSTIW